METSSSLGDKISKFFNPPTQIENENRQQQIKNTVAFVVATALIVYFRKGLERSLAKIADTA